MNADTRKRAKLPGVRLVTRLLRAFPAALEEWHLRWALSELTARDPMHRDVPYIVRRISELGSR